MTWLKREMERIWKDLPCQQPVYGARWIFYKTIKGLWYWSEETYGYLISLKGRLNRRIRK